MEQFFLFWVDRFLEGTWCGGKQIGSHSFSVWHAVFKIILEKLCYQFTDRYDTAIMILLSIRITKYLKLVDTKITLW